jgi:hypothetical protein
MACPFRALFAGWLAVVLTGTVVSHRHFADPGHTHGFGWTDCSGESEHDGGAPLHHHLILLGVELGAVPGSADGTEQTEGTQPTTGELVPTERAHQLAELSADDFSTLPPTLFPDHTILSATAAPLAVTHSGRVACPLVSRARTGVLRS